MLFFSTLLGSAGGSFSARPAGRFLGGLRWRTKRQLEISIESDACCVKAALKVPIFNRLLHKNNISSLL
jgi:hypothetical protein